LVVGIYGNEGPLEILKGLGSVGFIGRIERQVSAEFFKAFINILATFEDFFLVKEDRIVV
jgi:hypothetical protein